jgi:hypothetical protein
VCQRLRSSEDVVRLDERPELGIRWRLFVGICAATQHLGTIWVQEGGRPFAERAKSALLGAARIAAASVAAPCCPGHPLTRGPGGGALGGRIRADRVAGQLGLDPAASVIVLAFAPREVARPT